jgi:hypothetical protein
MLAAGEDAETLKQLEDLRKQIQALRQETIAEKPVNSGKAEALVENKYGPNAKVTSKQGKLTIGALAQVWYYAVQNDNHNWVDQQTLAPGAGTASQFGSNETADNDSFALRRMRLIFTLDVTENVRAFVMINGAAASAGRPTLPDNQGGFSMFTNAGFNATTGAPIGSVRNATAQGNGPSATDGLEEAWINYHDVIPHHDLQVGLMIRKLGEEGPRPSGMLDFVERAMINQFSCFPDSGVQLHGTWWDDRLQYYLAAYNGAGSAFQARICRGDDNDEKDFLGTVLVRPVWKDETWGSLELGYTLVVGKGGEAGGLPGTNPVDGLNFPETTHRHHQAWASYFPGGPVKGWWLRGEWGKYRDRFRSNEVISYFTGLGSVRDPTPIDIQAWYFATGYKISDSVWANSVPSWLKPCEFTFRYDTMQNLFYADLTRPSTHTDVFSSQVYTAGLNYYIRGHHAKIQVNYNWCREEAEDSGLRQVREVRNDSLMVCFQVMW